MRIYDKSMSRHDLCIFLLVRLSYFYATSKKAIFSAPISTKTDKKQRDFISKWMHINSISLPYYELEQFFKAICAALSLSVF